MQLQQFFEENPRIAIAFSGGVDSSYLLYAAKAAGADVHAYYVKAEFQPQFEFEEAVYIAKLLDIPLTVETMSVLSEPDVVSNSAERCYHCKMKILERLWALAHADGYTVLCDGTNADDDESDRPGMKALREQGVVSPLRDGGLIKNNIRILSKKAGLPTHNKPAYACLATRVPTGTAITREFLTKIERAEGALFEMGFSDFRVRLIPPDTAKIQMPEKQWKKAAATRERIFKALESDFSSVVLDMEFRN
ncbi:MAG: ATP-dependent sacrificial sulfur transferase LarE [Oscillospiraceae bacterium]|nr:ATP-dependent sacrificial sulfur transferase LarE [Oscillospiraceae bacterium]